MDTGGLPSVRRAPERLYNLYELRSRSLRGFLGLVAAAGAALALVGAAGAATPRVLAIHFDGDLEINPVTKDYVVHQLDVAAKKHYDAAVILLDTPGGLLQSMRVIYQKELASPIPVIVYVAPPGARAASAGVWVSQAADVLAMAPVSNIGSSTPITGSGTNIGSDLKRKVVNDAVASLTALAQSHHRNTMWPALAVRKASNLTSAEALRMHVIDVVAPTLPALLDRLDGYRTKDADRPYTLHLKGATIDEVHPGFFTRFLNVLIDPNIIPLLFLAGLAGIGFEIFHPGVVLPGALGVVALVCALFGFSVLPLSWAGLVLLLLGVFLVIVDLHVTSHGALTVSGLIALSFGAILLFRNAPPPYHVNKALVIAVAVALGSSWAFALSKAYEVRRRPATVGPQTVVGMVGEVRRDGLVFVNGELWRARTTDGADLRPGDAVRVESLDDGLVLTVAPAAGLVGSQA
jgi:membrane-bound serine protease (ClpP class)